ncbi:hypothetical protein BCR44DRAFT_1238123 [Catenaria anguillulae PL171]|uniref:Uncharacterized protein n=1 Tax=Catenaria anguillulae PL171 TaxID=765915 RepID=A0A1Y2HFF2_9FUNG|nr:hypothetical protein BCR44DRAFT_1238123 [Catenaria anguillulae PL171]
MASRSPVRGTGTGTGGPLTSSPRSRSPPHGVPVSPRTHARPSSPTIRASTAATVTSHSPATGRRPASPRGAPGTGPAAGTGRNRSPSPSSAQYRPTAKALTMSALRRAVSPPPTRGFKGTQTDKSENEPTDALYQTPSSPPRRNPQDTRPPPILRHSRPSSPSTSQSRDPAASGPAPVAGEKSQPPSFASAPGDFSAPSFDISVNPTSVILALEPGRRTPPTKRILQKLTSATNVLKQGGRISPRSASSSEGEDDERIHRHVLGDVADAERTLANVLEVLEGVFDVTLVASDKSINIKDIESRLLAWKRKHLAASQRVSLVDRVAPPPASPTALTSDLLDTRKLLASERHRAETLTSELNAARAHLAQQKQHWRDRDAKQVAEISRLQAQVDRLRAQLDAASSELWTELEQVKTELDERTRAGQEQAATIAAQRTELERAVQRVHELEAQDEQLNQDLDRVHQELTRAVGDKQALETELHEIRAELERVMADVARGNEQVRRTTASAREATQAQVQLERVQAEVVEVERRAREAEAHLASTRRELELVRKQLGEANGREEEARDRAGEAERARRGLEAQLAELEDKVHALKSMGRKRDEDLHAARKLLADRDRSSRMCRQVQTIVGERDQLAVLRRDLQQQVDKLRTDHDRIVNTDRKLRHELDETRAQLRDARETGAELKRHVDLLQTTKQGAERTVAEYENKCKHWEVQVRKTEDELAHARKEIETVTLQRINMEERVDKLQAKLHQFSVRADEHKRELQGARSVAETRANELDTLQLKWKQVLTENKDLDHRVRSLEARVEQAHADRDSLAKQLSSESKTFKDKLSVALANAQELDKQLVEAKTQAQLALGERDRLISDNKKLLSKIEKYAERMNQADGRAAKAVEEKNKYERKTRELAKYKTLYQNVLEAGLLVDRPQLGGAAGMEGMPQAAVDPWRVRRCGFVKSAWWRGGGGH